MALYRCVRTCHWQENIWQGGKFYDLPAGQEPPHHFERVEEPPPKLVLTETPKLPEPKAPAARRKKKDDGDQQG